MTLYKWQTKQLHFWKCQRPITLSYTITLFAFLQITSVIIGFIWKKSWRKKSWISANKRANKTMTTTIRWVKYQKIGLIFLQELFFKDVPHLFSFRLLLISMTWFWLLLLQVKPEQMYSHIVRLWEIVSKKSSFTHFFHPFLLQCAILPISPLWILHFHQIPYDSHDVNLFSNIRSFFDGFDSSGIAFVLWKLEMDWVRFSFNKL